MEALNNLCDPKISVFHHRPFPHYARNRAARTFSPLPSTTHHHHHHHLRRIVRILRIRSSFFLCPLRSLYISLFSLFHVRAGAIHSFYFRRSSSTNLYPQITDPPRILHPSVTSFQTSKDPENPPQKKRRKKEKRKKEKENKKRKIDHSDRSATNEPTLNSLLPSLQTHNA